MPADAAVAAQLPADAAVGEPAAPAALARGASAESAEKRERARQRMQLRRKIREQAREERAAKRELVRADLGPEEADRLAARDKRRAERAAAREQRRASGREGVLDREQARQLRRQERAERRARRLEAVRNAKLAEGKKAVVVAGAVAPAAPRVIATPLPEPAVVAAVESGPDTERSETAVVEARESNALRRAPGSAPQVRINILQWSSDPARRFVYVSLEGDPSMTQVREGETYQGLEVKRIHPEEVEFGHQGGSFLLSAN